MKAYLNHFELDKKMKFRHFVIFAVFYYFANLIKNNLALSYNYYLWSADIAAGFFVLFNLLVFMPLIYRGVITAYYKKSYNKSNNQIISLFYALTASALGRVLPYIFDKNAFGWLTPLKFHFPTLLIVAGLYFLFIYSLFYKDRYITIKRYSLGVDFILETNEDYLNEVGAARKFLSHYDDRVNPTRRKDELKKKTKDIVNDPLLTDILRTDLVQTGVLEQQHIVEDELIRRKTKRVLSDK